MKDGTLWRKLSRLVMMLSESLNVDVKQALDIFYSTQVYMQLSNPKYGLHLMSDAYILEDLLKELKCKDKTHS